MPAGVKRNPIVAVDTNVLLDRANDDELVIDAFATILRRLPACELIVTPTVVEEIVLKAERDDQVLDRRLAKRVLASLVDPWGFRVLNFIPVGRGIVAEIAQ